MRTRFQIQKLTFTITGKSFKAGREQYSIKFPIGKAISIFPHGGKGNSSSK
jgi:hypothetical protein